MTTIITRTSRSIPSTSRTRTVPVEMKAAAIDRFGPPKALTLRTIPVPQPGPGEVLIELHAAGVGVWDASVRDGSWRPYGRARLPLVPGTDGAGIIVAKGPRVRRFDIGDRVWATDYANPKNGFYAEYIAVNIENVGIMPRRFGFPEAAAGMVTGLTALQGIDDALRVQRDETILVFGATGGVGTLAVQFAKRRQARVIATATGSDAVALAERLGVDGTFDARDVGAIDELRALAPEGIDAALVLSGGGGLEPCLDLVKPGGRIAYPNGVWPEPSKRRKVQVTSYNAESGHRAFDRLEHAAIEARLKVPIAAEFALEEAAKAHERLQEGHILGRIVLRMRGRAR